MQKLVVIGAGDGFWEINELVKDINAVKKKYDIIAILDDDQNKHGLSFEGVIIQGPISLSNSYPTEVKFVFAIGSYKNVLLRYWIINNLGIETDRFETLIHPTAKVFSDCIVGKGCIIHYGSVVYSKTIISSFSVISANCVIGVKNILGTGALLGSNITTTTGVKIGSYSFIGSSVTIGENLEVNPGAIVGLGTTLLQTVKSGLKVIGNPLKTFSKQEVPEEIINEWSILKNSFYENN